MKTDKINMSYYMSKDLTKKMKTIHDYYITVYGNGDIWYRDSYHGLVNWGCGIVRS